MSDAPYEPPKVWTWNKESGGRFAAINRPIAGPTHDKELPVGRHPMQLRPANRTNLLAWGLGQKSPDRERCITVKNSATGAPPAMR